MNVPMKVVVADAKSGKPDHISEEEWAVRLDLAAAYRLVDHFDMTQLVYPHITAKVPGPEKHFLINEYGLSYDEIQSHTGIDANSLKVFLEQKRYLKSLDAIRLARFFGEGDGYFVYLQAEHRAAQEINGITT